MDRSSRSLTPQNRLMAALLAVVIAAALLALTPPAAHAAAPITGRLVDSTASGASVPNMTVRLRTVTETGPGSIVVSDVTASDGSFSLDAGSTPDDEYYVQVVAGSYQGGWVGGNGAAGMDWVQPTAGDATTYGPGNAIGRIQTLPAFVSGKVVNAATGNPVRGVTVRVTEGSDTSTVYGSDVTNVNGQFRVNGLSGEDNFGLRVNGAAKNYESGWVGCDNQVYQLWENACGGPLGRAGRIFLEHL